MRFSRRPTLSPPRVRRDAGEIASAATNSPDGAALVERLLDDAVARRASDVHVEPIGASDTTPSGYELRYRIDGLLETSSTLSSAEGRAIVARLMVLARLLTYRLDVPQEGRASVPVSSAGKSIELRVAVMPTTHGLRAAVRLPADLLQPRTLEELLLPRAVMDGLDGFARADSGMLLLVGPAGSGKTTTIYALLEHLTARSRSQLSIVSLEDPVERDLRGVTQIEVTPFGELTYERALRSMLRQDPQVLMIGEIRDGATAALAIQAAMSGHRLISTLHATDPGGAIARLLEMGLEPYQIAGSLYGVVAQRLLRRCHGAAGTYRGRVPAAEFVRMDDALRRAVVARADVSSLRAALATQKGHASLRAAAADLIHRGMTDDAEVARVLGDPVDVASSNP